MQKIASLIAATILIASNASAADDELGAYRIVQSIDQNDCKTAVAMLNEGVARNYPSILKVAGSMFEGGICVKKSWERASLYYQRAYEGGNEKSLNRLISGFAQNGDGAAALWWESKKNSRPDIPACGSANHLNTDPDAFVAALNKWPQGQIAACVYVIGVYNRIAGDMEYTDTAATNRVDGSAMMHFVPATGTIEWKIKKTSDRSEFKHELLKNARKISDRSLAQFTRPAGIDPEWTIEGEFSFTML